MTASTTTQPRASFRQLRNDLAVIFLERREVIDGALCAILAGEHVLLLGPPDPQTLCVTSPSPRVS